MPSLIYWKKSQIGVLLVIFVREHYMYMCSMHQLGSQSRV